LEVVRVLIAKGADMNARDLGDWTPLSRALVEKHSDVAALLISEGADVNLLNDSGVSALDNAVDFGLSDIVEMLRNAGAKCGTSHAYSKNCKNTLGQN
jgi:ankyrin repeat protein